MTEDHPLRASALVASGSFCFAFMGLCVKLAEQQTEATTFSLFAIRSLLGLILNGLATLAHLGTAAAGGSGVVSAVGAGRRSKRGCGCPSRESWVWLGTRCVAGFTCVVLEYLSLSQLPLAINTMIVYSCPAWIVLWAAVLLGEPVKPIVVACLGVSVAGLVLIVRPWSLESHKVEPWAYGAALLASIFAGLSYVCLRQLKGVHFHVVLNFFQGTCFVASVGLGLALDQFPIPELSSPAWRYLICVGIASYGAEVCITLGYAQAGKSLGQVSVLKFLCPIFSGFLGALFLGEAISRPQILGSALVLAASATILYVTSPGADSAGKKYDVPSDGSSETWSGSCGDASPSDSDSVGRQASSSGPWFGGS